MAANTETIITELATRGITLQAEGGHIRAHGQLDDKARALIRNHKARLLAALTQKVELDAIGLPFKPCPRCNHGHFWLSGNGWQCSDCYPMPAGVFMGETCTVDSPNPLPVIETPQAEPETTGPAWVRCCDCDHHVPSETDPKHGIGRCRVESPAMLRPAPWPMTERRCGEYQAREAPKTRMEPSTPALEGELVTGRPRADAGELVMDAMILCAQSKASSEDSERQRQGARPWTYKQAITRTLELLHDECAENGRSFEACASRLAQQEKQHIDWVAKIKAQVEAERRTEGQP